MALSAREQAEVDAANRSGRPVAVFVHGLWLLPGSWDEWRRLFEDSGYATVAPDWPGDAESVAEAKAAPDTFAKRSLTAIVDHQAEVVRALDARPAILGHSFGGLLTQMLAGTGLASVSVAIDAAPARGVLPLPFSALKVASVVLSNPANRGRAVGLTAAQFRYGFGNAVSAEESQALYEKYSVARLRDAAVLRGDRELQPAHAGEGRREELGARPDAGDLGREGPHRAAGDLEGDLQAAAKERARADRARPRSSGRGHSLTIDSGWREVADVALAFVTKHYPATSPEPGRPA